jgi:hypothetical protein
MRTNVLVIAFLLIGCAVCGKGQQPLVGMIEGTVSDQSGSPIAFVNLRATNIDRVEPDSPRRTTVSDKNGNYQFVDVPPGRYAIVFKLSGYRDYTVSLVKVYPGQTVKMREIKMWSAKTRPGK